MSVSSSDENLRQMNIEDPNGKSDKGFFARHTFLKIVGICAVVAALFLVIFLPIYFTVIDDDEGVPTEQTIPDITDDERYDCYPEEGATEEGCEARGCVWFPSEVGGPPSCVFYEVVGYSSNLVNNNMNGIESRLSLPDTNMFDQYGTQFSSLTVKTSYVSGSTLRIKYYPDGDRYEVPIDHPATITKPSDALYEVDHIEDNGNFGVKVTRLSNSKVLFDTSVGQLMFADQFLQISTKVASEFIYGFGEHMHESFKHDMNWKTYGMFSRDQGVGTNVNLYGVHPYFMCMEGDGNAYGVFFVNSNAMDVTLQPTPAITYRSIGGVIDFYIFLGPTPEQVTDQYTSLIGRPFFPPYWSLGFQLSRYGYENLDNLTRVVNRNLAASYPYEIQYSDIDYMERQLDFTIDEEAYGGLGDFVKDLKENHGMRYIIILDPAISGNETAPYPPFTTGVEQDIFIKDPNGDIAWGKVWPDYPNVTVNSSKPWDYQTENYRAYAAFPDFYLPQTTEWWKNHTVEFHNRIEFDGLWIDMNEPASFAHGSPHGCPDDSLLDNEPYHPKLASENLYDKTLCMQNRQYNPATGEADDHYNLHSLYGLSQTQPTLEACRASTGERCIVISRSTYPGSGKTVGHWLGDNTSSWEHLAASIIGMLEFNLFGIPYIGADVCGFFQDTTDELCLRWMQLGAFYPFDRNHNGLGFADQDPGAFDEAFINATRKVLETRYTLLPYLYTLFYEAHLTGATVVRPLMNQFPFDTTTYTVETQFLWGPALLITPALEEGQMNVKGYFPESRWFDYYTGSEMAAVGKELELDSPLDHINLHVQGGHIVPTQEPGLTTYQSRQNGFGLIVALDSDNTAEGKLFWDDGTSEGTIENKLYTLITFSCQSNTLESNILHSGEDSKMALTSVSVMGVAGDEVTQVRLNGVTYSEFTYAGSTLTITGLDLDLRSKIEIRWEIGDQWKRFDCSPSKSEVLNKQTCEERGCSWDASCTGDLLYPCCYYAIDDETKIPSYTVNTTERLTGPTTSYTLTRNEGPEIYGTPVNTLKFDAEYQTNNRFHFKLSNPDLFEIPEEILNLTSDVLADETTALYEVEVDTSNTFSLKISRKSTGKVVFDTSVGPLIFEDRFLEISTIFPSENVFGFGEHNHRRYRHDLNWKRWAIFTRDVAPIDEWNFYGHHTFYMAIDDTDAGTAIGVYLHNTNAMDVTLKPTPAVTYRITGGVLDFYVFVGDSQEHVVQLYHNFIGLPAMPPYWMLGFQLSRWDYGSLDRVNEVVNEMRDAKMPFDVQYGDIDYMEAYKDFTYDKDNFAGLPEFVDYLHSNGMKYIIILDPGIKIEEGYRAYDQGMEQNVFVMDRTNTKPVLTEVWPGETYHPDFTHPNATVWWTEQCREFFQNQSVEYDALWVDMNEPANFQPDDPDKFEKMNCSDEYNKPPYMPNILDYDRGLHAKTICMENNQYLGLHQNFHSLYGHTMATATYSALEEIMGDKRSYVLTRSSFAGTGKYAGHWLGDNQSQWRQMPWAIIGMLEFNLFGFPFIGADICGFWYNTTEEMCQRWMQVGAFYPFSRNHNAQGWRPQHPTAFSDSMTASSKKVLEIRYSILPYMYTLIHQAHMHGGTVVRSLIHEFPQDRNTWDVDTQFLLGSGFLVTPVMEEGMTSVTAYFPEYARWFDFHTHEEVTQTGKFMSLDAPLDHINLHVRGGVTIPMQSPDVTTSKSRTNPMSLLVALDQSEYSSGELFWDDGESRDSLSMAVLFTTNNSILDININHAPPPELDVSSLFYEAITVLGIKGNVTRVLVDADESGGIIGSGEGEPATFMFENQILTITDLVLPINQSHVISWE